MLYSTHSKRIHCEREVDFVIFFWANTLDLIIEEWSQNSPLCCSWPMQRQCLPKWVPPAAAGSGIRLLEENSFLKCYDGLGITEESYETPTFATTLDVSCFCCVRPFSPWRMHHPIPLASWLSQEETYHWRMISVTAGLDDRLAPLQRFISSACFYMPRSTLYCFGFVLGRQIAYGVMAAMWSWR